MAYVALGHRLPKAVTVPLFGDRERFGKVPDRDDPSWKEWLTRGVDFYNANQRQSVGRIVNHGGYKIIRDVDLAGQRVLEIGPGALDHIAYWKGTPDHFTCLDINSAFLELAAARLRKAGVPHTLKLSEPSTGDELPFDDASFDVVLSFYSLEHIHPISPYLKEISRVLRPGGTLAGAIPCEGGLAWGLGRYITSRRWLLRNTTIDPNRIICWEHPNFADTILNAIDERFDRRHVTFWPLLAPAIDINLISRFIVTQRSKI